MKYNEKVERFAPKLGRKNLVNGLSCPPFVYMEDSEDGMWVHYVKYCEAIAKLKDKIESLENLAKSSNSDFASEYNELNIEIFKLQGRIKELEAQRDAFEKSFNEMTEAYMRSQRALWIAHAYKAKFKRWWLHLALDCEASMIRPDTKTINRIKGKIENCEKSERKCRAKAKEYE